MVMVFAFFRLYHWLWWYLFIDFKSDYLVLKTGDGKGGRLQKKEREIFPFGFIKINGHDPQVVMW
jgi:hypothetical protein